MRQLIGGCARNDRVSQEKLYRQFYAPLFALCRRFFVNDHEAMESVNDGMMKVFEKIGSYHEDKGRFFNWVYTIVRNTAVDKFRSAVSIPVMDPGRSAEVLADADPDHDPGLGLERRQLSLLFDRLSPAPRGICNLFYVEGYTIREIAGQLGVSIGTVKWHLSESRKKLRPIFEKYF